MTTLKLLNYLGPNIDIGPTMMEKIIKEKNQVLCRSMYQALTQDRWVQEECKAEGSLIMEFLHQRLCPCTMVHDLVELGAEDKPEYDPYEDKSHNAEMFPILDK